MAKKADSGFATNSNNFKMLYSKVDSMGNNYAPTNPNASLAALKTMLTNAQAAGTSTNKALAVTTGSVNQRRNTFSGVKKLGPRIVRAFKSQVKDPEAVRTLDSISKKLQGIRIGKQPPKSKMKELGADANKSGGISASQQSYTYIVEHLEKMVETLALHNGYAPNEADLKLAALQKRITDMRAANQLVVDANTDLGNTRVARNELHTGLENSIYTSSVDVKNYLFSIDGKNNPDYKAVSKLKFMSPPKLKKK